MTGAARRRRIRARPAARTTRSKEHLVSRQLVIALLALFTAALVAPAAASASSRQVMTFEAPRELLDDAQRESTLDTIQSFGVDRVRALVYWNSFTAKHNSKHKPKFDRADPDAYPAETFGRLDRLVDSVTRRGMSIQLTLTGPVPRWATKHRRGHVNTPSAREFGRWAKAIARRFGDRVDLWSIWNEPNHPDFLRPQYKHHKPKSPRIYRRLYKAGEHAIHSVPGGADDTVLFGETAPIGNANLVAPLQFLRKATCLNNHYHRKGHCKRLRIDGYAHHAYTRKEGPTFVHPDRDDVSIGDLSRLVAALDKAARAGVVDKHLPIYLTEFGIQSKPDPIAGVGLKRQAEFLAIAEKMAYANPRVAAFSQYLLRDDQPRPGPRIQRYSGFETGLEKSNGKHKPSYRGFMLPLAVKRYGSSDVLWGRVRPADGPTEVVIQHKRGKHHWKKLTVVQTSSDVYGLRADHKRRQRYRVRWTRPDGSRVTGPPIRPY
jgi:Cellulase (glycosyl hydrolase family 5)